MSKPNARERIDKALEEQAERKVREELIEKLPDSEDGQTKELTPDQKRMLQRAMDFDIEPHITRLQVTSGFYNSVFMRITKVRCTGHLMRQIPTAAMGVRDMTMVFYWNPLFFADLTYKEIQGILRHEIYHLILLHCTSRMRENRMLWNFATDLAINSLIGEDWLPKSCLYPGKGLVASPSVKSAWTQAQLKAFEHLNEVIKGFSVKLTSEFYYGQLQKEWDEIKDFVDMSMAASICGQFDSHDGWEDIPDELRDALNERVRGYVREAIREADENPSQGWGDMPVEAQHELRKLISRQVDWRSLLRQFIGNSLRSDYQRTRMRRHRKYGLMQPGKKPATRARVMIAVDESGSVSDESLALVFAELNNLSSQVEFVFVPFDFTVEQSYVCLWKKNIRRPPKREKCGGTSFDAPTVYINEQHANGAPRADGLIIITDGYAPAPGPCLVRRAWLIVPDCPRPAWMDELRDPCMQMTWPTDRTGG